VLKADCEAQIWTGFTAQNVDSHNESRSLKTTTSTNLPLLSKAQLTYVTLSPGKPYSPSSTATLRTPTYSLGAGEGRQTGPASKGSATCLRRALANSSTSAEVLPMGVYFNSSSRIALSRRRGLILTFFVLDDWSSVLHEGTHNKKMPSKQISRVNERIFMTKILTTFLLSYLLLSQRWLKIRHRVQN
jgi:hypothetical protein